MNRKQSSPKGKFTSFLFHQQDVRFMTVIAEHAVIVFPGHFGTINP